MLQRIGIIVMVLGAMCADSECLLIPIGVTSIGALLVWISIGREARDETA